MPKYNENDLHEALQMVKDGASAYGAAKACNVPKSTILWRMKNETPKKVGRKTKLDVDDEQNIVN